MPSALEAMASRATGSYPISIATSLAIESAFGRHPDKPPVDPPPIRAVRAIWFNVRTLVRNFLGAIPTEAQGSVRAEDVIQGLMAELTIIEQVIASETQGYCSSMFYVCDYSRVMHNYRDAWVKLPKTPKQIQYNQLEDKAVKGLLKAPIAQHIRLFNYELLKTTQLYPAAMILTHLPIDLLSRYNFDSLSLLESHTGAVKRPEQWNTKLTNGKEFPNMPFGRFTLSLFGDNGNMFSAAPQRLRDIVIDLARFHQWTNITTKEKIRFSLSRIPNDIDRNKLMSLL